MENYPLYAAHKRKGHALWTVAALWLLLSVAALDVFGQAKTASHNLFYMRNNEASIGSFLAHADQISIVGPQVYGVEEDGVLFGYVDQRVLEAARQHDVKVMPLIHNPGFRMEPFKLLLNDPGARARCIQQMVNLAIEHGFYGWQFDFEHIHVSDRNLFTQFYREAADALHEKGFALSIAVVPTNGKTGPTRHRSVRFAEWAGCFDFKALGEIGDFISLMTYDQHSLFTPPGPVAGLPWAKEMLDYALEQGVPMEKLSMGIPSYSVHWLSAYNEQMGRHATGPQIGYDRVLGLLERFDAETTWLEDQGVNFATWTNDGTFEYVYVEDRFAMEAKLGLFSSYEGLHGISVWVLGSEDPGIWDVLARRTRTRRD